MTRQRRAVSLSLGSSLPHRSIQMKQFLAPIACLMMGVRGNWGATSLRLPIMIAVATLCISSTTRTDAQNTQVKFEVVSIKPAPSGSTYTGSGANETGYSATNVPLSQVIAQAYLTAANPEFVPPVDWVKNGPKWVIDDRYDIVAKVDDTSIERLKSMTQMQRTAAVAQALRAMLADRFKLTTRTIQVNVPGYALLIGKHGIKMKEASPEEPAPTRGMAFGGTWRIMAVRSPDGGPSANRYVQITMAELAAYLGSGTTPVVDQTGLSGRYDFDLPFMDAVGSREEGSLVPSRDVAHKFDWAAVGLEMKPLQVQVPGVSIEHIERPSAN